MTESSPPPRSRSPSAPSSPVALLHKRQLEEKVNVMLKYIQEHYILIKNITTKLDALNARLDKRPISPSHVTNDSVSSTPKLDERNIKLDDFTGQGSPEDYLDWERQVDKIADVKELDDKLVYKLAYLRLNKHAGLWFDGVNEKRK